MTHMQLWRDCWASLHTPWDLGRAHPFCADLLDMAINEAGLVPGSSFWVPGCGRGHEARFLAERGYAVIAEDLMPEAINAARDAGVPGGLTFGVGDALSIEKSMSSTFDAVFDRAMLCALHPKFRAAYRDACFDRLKPGGLFMGIIFARLNPDLKGPPYSLMIQELVAAWQDGFSLLAGAERDAPYDTGNIYSEFLVILRKKN